MFNRRWITLNADGSTDELQEVYKMLRKHITRGKRMNKPMLFEICCHDKDVVNWITENILLPAYAKEINDVCSNSGIEATVERYPAERDLIVLVNGRQVDYIDTENDLEFLIQLIYEKYQIGLEAIINIFGSTIKGKINISDFYDNLIKEKIGEMLEARLLTFKPSESKPGAFRFSFDFLVQRPHKYTIKECINILERNGIKVLYYFDARRHYADVGWDYHEYIFEVVLKPDFVAL